MDAEVEAALEHLLNAALEAHQPARVHDNSKAAYQLLMRALDGEDVSPAKVPLKSNGAVSPRGAIPE